MDSFLYLLFPLLYAADGILAGRPTERPPGWTSNSQKETGGGADNLRTLSAPIVYDHPPVVPVLQIVL